MTQNETEGTAAPSSAASGSAADQREKRKWWAVTEFGVQEVTGYTCEPMNPGYWWCPEVGSSMCVGYGLFANETDALDKAADNMEREIDMLNTRLAIVKQRRLNASPSRSAGGKPKQGE